jgi:hypothetical protein
VATQELKHCPTAKGGNKCYVTEAEPKEEGERKQMLWNGGQERERGSTRWQPKLSLLPNGFNKDVWMQDK